MPFHPPVRRFRKSLLVIPLAAVGLSLTASPPALVSAAAADITTICTASSVSGTTITLTDNCVTTVPLGIPDGFTLDGAQHTIIAHDPQGSFFVGAVVTNNGTSMNLKNLTVQ